jgi:hypothetical protein
LNIRSVVGNDPRYAEKGVINPTEEVAATVGTAVPPDLEARGFKYIPGYKPAQP